MKPALKKWVIGGVKKGKLFERSEFLSFSRQAHIFSSVSYSLDFFVTFCVKTKSKGTEGGVKKDNLFERSEFLSFSRQAHIFSSVSYSLDFFVTFCVKTKSKGTFASKHINNDLHITIEFTTCIASLWLLIARLTNSYPIF